MAASGGVGARGVEVLTRARGGIKPGRAPEARTLLPVLCVSRPDAPGRLDGRPGSPGRRPPCCRESVTMLSRPLATACLLLALTLAGAQPGAPKGAARKEKPPPRVPSFTED